MKYNRLGVFGLGALGCASLCVAQEVQIAATSFEEPAVFPSVQYVDTGLATENHGLVNNDAQPLVNYVSIGGELGFSAFYTNSRNDVGLTEGDFVGVQDFLGDFGTGGAYSDGVHGFEIADSDGLMTVTLDAVDLTGLDTARVSLDVFVNETSWETVADGQPVDDRVRVWVVVDGGQEIDLLNTGGTDLDNLGIEEAWRTYGADLTGFTTATVMFEVDSNASTESAYLDNVRFFGVPTPPPEFTIDVFRNQGNLVTLTWANAPANTPLAIIYASSAGSFVIPNSFTCAGTQLGLSNQNIRLVRTVDSGPDGSGEINGQSANGGFVQMLVSSTCATSNVDGF